MKSSISQRIIRKILITTTAGMICCMSLFGIISIRMLNNDMQKNMYNCGNYVVGQFDQSLSQIEAIANWIMYCDSFRTRLQAYFMNDGHTEMEYARICTDLQSYVSARSDIYCVVLDDQNSGEKFHSIVNYERAKFDELLFKNRKYRDLSESDYGSLLLLMKDQDGEKAIYSKVFNFGHHRIIVSMVFSTWSIKSITESVLLSEVDDYCWISREGTIISNDRTQAWIVNAIDRYNSGELSLEKIAKDQKGYTMFFYSLKNKWMLALHIQRDGLTDKMTTFIIPSVFVLILACLFVVMGSPIIIKKQLMKLKELETTMQKVAKGDYNVRSEIRTNDEIGSLSNVFNWMIDNMKAYIEDVKKKEDEKTRMSFNLRLSQISPHFIYNTMNIINILVKRNQLQEVIEVNSSLIRIMRYVLRISETDIMATVEYEKQYVEDYLTIQRYRNNGDFKVVWDIDPLLMNQKILRNVIQPLVENALLHGIIDENDGTTNGVIKIGINKENDEEIRIEVEDNGRGIERNRLEMIITGELPQEDCVSMSNHNGIINIRDRLRYVYGSKGRLYIESKYGTGTKIIVFVGNESKTEFGGGKWVL